MRVFKTKIFHQWAEDIKLDNAVLCRTTEELIQGRYEACLGSNLYKKRIAFGGKGKSGGLRLIIAFKQEKKVFFVYGFKKNKKGNIAKKEVEALKEQAQTYLMLNEEQIQKAIETKKFIEIL